MFRRIRMFLVSALLIAAAVYLADDPTSQTQSDRPKSNLGFLEHRGKRYWLSDLMDPAYRAASDDRFVRQFGQQPHVAMRENGHIIWAGSDYIDYAEGHSWSIAE